MATLATMATMATRPGEIQSIFVSVEFLSLSRLVRAGSSIYK